MGNKTSTRKMTKKLRKINPNDIPMIPYRGCLIPCRVVDVYDGDTCTIILLINRKTPFKIKLRILGIDTPEKARCGDHEKQAGKAVAEYTQKLIHDMILNVELDRWGKYGGRILGHLYLPDGTTLSQHLIDNKLGKPYMGQKKELWTKDELDFIISKCKSL